LLAAKAWRFGYRIAAVAPNFRSAESGRIAVFRVPARFWLTLRFSGALKSGFFAILISASYRNMLRSCHPKSRLKN
jgi:hypothetical protein